MEPRIKSHRLESVAAILEREVDFTIKEWTRQVSLIPSLTNVLLSDEDRTGHLPQLFNDMLSRMRATRETKPLVSIAAHQHGRQRFLQGYSAAMLVEESRILEVTTFFTLHLHQDELDQNQALPDVLIIADEADRQLEETMRGFMAAAA